MRPLGSAVDFDYLNILVLMAGQTGESHPVYVIEPMHPIMTKYVIDPAPSYIL